MPACSSFVIIAKLSFELGPFWLSWTSLDKLFDRHLESGMEPLATAVQELLHSDSIEDRAVAWNIVHDGRISRERAQRFMEFWQDLPAGTLRNAVERYLSSGMLV